MNVLQPRNFYFVILVIPFLRGWEWKWTLTCDKPAPLVGMHYKSWMLDIVNTQFKQTLSNVGRAKKKFEWMKSKKISLASSGFFNPSKYICIYIFLHLDFSVYFTRVCKFLHVCVLSLIILRVYIQSCLFHMYCIRICLYRNIDN